MPRHLRRILIILGGVREAPMDGAQERRRPKSTRRNRSQKGIPTTEHRHQDVVIRRYPQQWKEVHCVVTNVNRKLKTICYITPIGRITLKQHELSLLQLKEQILAESALANSANQYWHVVDELSWTELDDYAKSELLRIMGGDLPDVFWETSDPLRPPPPTPQEDP